MLTTDPTRPAFVPNGATYDAELDAWEVVETDANGQRRGECRAYRHADGSLYRLSRFVDGVAEGPFTVFHPNGQPALAGAYVAGKLEGAVRAFGSDGPTELKLRSCCVPSGAWELRSRYRGGLCVKQVFYDREGFPLDSDGSRWPDRPARVPEEADYDAHNRVWVERVARGDGVELTRYFTSDGLPMQEAEYRNGQKTCERAFDDRGRLREERYLDEEGKFHGGSTRWFPNSEETPYSDPRVRLERGQFWRGQPVGTFTWLDEDEVVIARRELGAGLTLESLAASPALTAETLDWGADRVWALANELSSAARVRESLCAAARAAARDGDRARLEALLDATTLRHRDALRDQRGQLLLEAADVTPLTALDELLLGSDPAAAYRTFAAVFSGSRRVALEFVEAARLLAPATRSVLVTRALLRLELGEVEGVLEDAASLEPDSPPVAKHLRDSVRYFFSAPRCLPQHEGLEPVPAESAEVAFAQPLEAVRRLVQVYATRLGVLRRAVLDTVGSPTPWCPPDLSHLLSDGPIPLRRESATILDQTENGPEAMEVVIDERLDLAGASVTALMRMARADLAALAWLCWAVGLGEIALPAAVDPPADFAAAVNMAIARCFRARDQLQSNGLISRSRGVASFTWEGVDIDDLDPSFVAIAAAEYLEVRSMFLWAIFEENLSPFQSDVRSA